MNEKKLDIAITILEVTISIFKGIKKLRGIFKTKKWPLGFVFHEPTFTRGDKLIHFFIKRWWLLDFELFSEVFGGYEDGSWYSFDSSVKCKSQFYIVSFVTSLFAFINFCSDCQHFTRNKISQQLVNTSCEKSLKLQNFQRYRQWHTR